MPAHQRKSFTEIDHIYFWTATIHKWYGLLQSNEQKDLLIESLRNLSDRGLVTVYSFVIMPTHVHFMWKQNRLNGKETAFGSFLKFTAHGLLRYIKQQGKTQLFSVDVSNKRHEIWQRDSFAVEIRNPKKARQKLNYIHVNPVKGKWKLAKDDLDYYYSSARFYELGLDEFGFLRNIFDEFD